MRRLSFLPLGKPWWCRLSSGVALSVKNVFSILFSTRIRTRIHTSSIFKGAVVRDSSLLYLGGTCRFVASGVNDGWFTLKVWPNLKTGKLVTSLEM